jgi:hypothetical protein
VDFDPDDPPGSAGCLLTASFPDTETSWTARAREAFFRFQATLTVFAIAIRDEAGGWDVQHRKAVSKAPEPHPWVQAELDDGFWVTGGGANVQDKNALSYLTASYPNSAFSWLAQSKDHFSSSPTRIEAYVIGIKPLLSDKDKADPGVKKTWETYLSTGLLAARAPMASGKGQHITQHARSQVNPTIGGGARVDWTVGNLLTASFPQLQDQGWIAKCKDLLIPDYAVLNVFAIFLLMDKSLVNIPPPIQVQVV